MMSAGSAEDSDFLSGIFGMRPSANLNIILLVVFSFIKFHCGPISIPDFNNYAAHNHVVELLYMKCVGLWGTMQWRTECTYFLKSSPITQTTTKKRTIMHIMTSPRNIPSMSTYRILMRSCRGEGECKFLVMSDTFKPEPWLPGHSQFLLGSYRPCPSREVRG